MGHFRARLHAVLGIRPHFKEHPHGLPVRGNEVIPIVLLGQRPPPEFRHGRGVVRFRIERTETMIPGVGFLMRLAFLAGLRRAGDGTFTDIGHEIGKQAQRFGREQRVRVKHQIDEIVVPEESVERIDALQRGSPGNYISLELSNCRSRIFQENAAAARSGGNRAPSAEDPVGQAAKEKARTALTCG